MNPWRRGRPPNGERPGGGTDLSPVGGGRRTALILLLGVAAIWVFACWTLVTQAQDGLSGPEWVTAVLMLGILVVAPVVGWTLLEERAATITSDATGLTYRSITGIHLTYAWPEITGLGAARPRRRAGRAYLWTIRYPRRRPQQRNKAPPPGERRH